MVWLTEVESRHIDNPGIPSYVLRKRICVLTKLMSFEVYLRVEDNEFFLKTLPVETQEMVLLKMFLKRVVVLVVMRLPGVASVADEAPLMLVPTMFIELIVIIKPFATETAERMPLETRLVDCSGLVVAFPHMFLQLLVCK